MESVSARLRIPVQVQPNNHIRTPEATETSDKIRVFDGTLLARKQRRQICDISALGQNANKLWFSVLDFGSCAWFSSDCEAGLRAYELVEVESLYPDAHIMIPDASA